MPELHLWRMPVDPAGLARVTKAQRIPPADEDHGYVIHALLKALYGEMAPKPWRFDTGKRLVWAYAPGSLDAMKERSDLADPLYHAAVRWGESASKPMPILTVGRRVAFDLRACPVIRHGSRDGKDKASEHDYLLWRARRDGVQARDLDPRLVYVDWLRDHAWRPAEAGATLVSETVVVTGRSKPMEEGANAWRGRGDGRLRLPDVLLAGTLIVTNQDAFASFLARGVGRHRAFGFGMLLLRPERAG
jgi:CRISPR system Cascade subunit CasE